MHNQGMGPDTRYTGAPVTGVGLPNHAATHIIINITIIITRFASRWLEATLGCSTPTTLWGALTSTARFCLLSWFATAVMSDQAFERQKADQLPI
jgi:hypothetical protein